MTSKKRVTSKPFRTEKLKLIFLDISKFTIKRSVEDQYHIIKNLNSIILKALRQSSIKKDDRILIPTGDGVCIGIMKHQPYNIHINTAKRIRDLVHEYNQSEEKRSRKFKLRIGVHEHDDLIIKDINNSLNIAGDGINKAQRIMSVAEEDTIRVSPIVHDACCNHDEYHGHFQLHENEIKHDQKMESYELLNTKKDYQEDISEGSPIIPVSLSGIPWMEMQNKSIPGNILREVDGTLCVFAKITAFHIRMLSNN